MRKQCKPKPCSECKTEFQPMNSLTKVCSYSCALKRINRQNERKHAIALKKAEGAAKSERRARKARLKTKQDYLKELQAVVNKYARLRDKGRPCISCDKPDNGQHQRHASHWKSVGSNSALRFNLWNIHASCSQCNNWKSGNIGEYTPRLIEKIGREKVDWMETMNQAVKYDIEYLKRFKKIFAKRVRILESRYNEA